MKKKHFLLKIFIAYLFLTTSVFSSKLNYFIEGKILFEKDEFDKSKIFFEKDIVFNPKSEKSYLYLAKNVLLLNPENDEAIYMLTLLRIKQSNYNEAKELIRKFNLVCNSFCLKNDEMQEKFEKLIPEDAKD